MATTTQRRRKAEQRRAHAHRSDHRQPPNYALTAHSETLALIREQAKALFGEPTPASARGKCPECGFSQKIRKDGTMSRHDVWSPNKTECSGTGMEYKA